MVNKKVKVGDVICTSLRGFGTEGDPLFKVGKMPIFLKKNKQKYVVLGRSVKLKIIRVIEDKFAYGKIVNKETKEEFEAKKSFLETRYGK